MPNSASVLATTSMLPGSGAEYSRNATPLPTLKRLSPQAKALPVKTARTQPATVARIVVLIIAISGPKSLCLHV